MNYKSIAKSIAKDYSNGVGLSADYQAAWEAFCWRYGGTNGRFADFAEIHRAEAAMLAEMCGGTEEA